MNQMWQFAGNECKAQAPKISKVRIISLPKDKLQNNRNVYLYFDYIFVQGMSFLMTVSSDYKFRIVEPLLSKSKANMNDILQGVYRVVKFYSSCSLSVVKVSAENEFECIRDGIKPTIVNIL